LLCQFHAFLRPELLRDTVFHSTEFLSRRRTNRSSLENIVRAILPLLGIHAKLGHGENTLHEVRHTLHAFHPSRSRDKRSRHDLEVVLLSQRDKLLWIGLEGAQQVIDKRCRSIAGFILTNFVLDLWFDLGEGLCFHFALVLDPYNMPSKGGTYQVAELSHRQRESGFLERRNHLSTWEIAEVAPLLRRRRILRVLFGQGRKILTIPQSG
jgi:hypothetical protein